jgi:hypothetical protein
MKLCREKQELERKLAAAGQPVSVDESSFDFRQAEVFPPIPEEVPQQEQPEEPVAFYWKLARQ